MGIATTTARLRATMVLEALQRHHRKLDLVKVGKHRDSLLRALIPLCLMQNSGMRVTSGTTQRLWRKFGVKVQATVMAKALRERVGYSRCTRLGPKITPNGVKYVEAALRLLEG